MKMRTALALVVLITVLVPSSVLAYTSDRMDFGEIDFGGATVTFVMHWDGIAQFEEGGARAGMLQEAMELFNIGGYEKLVVGWGDVGDTALGRFLAGESHEDLWRVPFAYYWSLVSKGALFPVNEILPPEYFENLPKITRDRNYELAYNGQMFFFSAGVDDYGHATFIVFNKDLMEAEGLEDPYELLARGEWTFEKVTEMARKATRDTDGDGIIDQWGLSDVDPKNLVYAYGGAVTRRHENGNIYWALDEPESVLGLRQWVDWRKIDQIANGGENEFGTGQIAMAFLPFYAISSHVDWPFTHGIMPYPQGPHTDEPLFLPGAADAWFVPANAEYPLGLIALDNYLFTLDFYYEDLDGYIASRVADKQAYEILYTAVDSFWPEDYYMNFLGGRWNGSLPYGKVCGDINNDISPATAAAEAKPAAQAIIEDMFGL
ncbi:MAG: extracellular solute-binding protein [Firmicutes bacterium]|nr:extracellular solute-binding protein [Bacillota bacterium]